MHYLRPISLLDIGYKLFAVILLNRLKAAGADEQLWPTQFGFRKGRGTGDALFLARRAVERAWAEKDGKLTMLALDWAKAFDSVAPASLTAALLRFGVPEGFVKMIEAIYADRRFRVKDGGSTSKWHEQQAGISQGCPLSPFLFVIVMTILMQDAKRELRREHGVETRLEGQVEDLVYADDTLLLGIDDQYLQTFMGAVGSAGQAYGLSFNWKKLEALAVSTDPQITKPDGSMVARKDGMVYLGALLSSDGRIGSELNRRIGQAKGSFETLRRVWAHARLTVGWKLQVFESCVLSKLLYGLSTAVLLQADRRRLDGFYAQCLRRILKIPSSFYSRVSNSTVLEQAQATPLSARLLQTQMVLFGDLASRPDNDPVRCSIFSPGTREAAARKGLRRRGRPRTSWFEMVNQHCEHLQTNNESRAAWLKAVQSHITML